MPDCSVLELGYPDLVMECHGIGLRSGCQNTDAGSISLDTDAPYAVCMSIIHALLLVSLHLYCTSFVPHYHHHLL